MYIMNNFNKYILHVMYNFNVDATTVLVNYSSSTIDIQHREMTTSTSVQENKLEKLNNNIIINYINFYNIYDYERFLFLFFWGGGANGQNKTLNSVLSTVKYFIVSKKIKHDI